MSQDCNITSTAKYHATSMDSQRRRPSSIAEQAMRKLVLSNHPSSSLVQSTISSSPSSVVSSTIVPQQHAHVDILPPSTIISPIISSSISPNRNHHQYHHLQHHRNHPSTGIVAASGSTINSERLLESIPSVMQSTVISCSQVIPPSIPIRNTIICESSQQHMRENVYLRSLISSGSRSVDTTSVDTLAKQPSLALSSALAATTTTTTTTSPFMPNSVTVTDSLISIRDTNAITSPQMLSHDNSVDSTLPIYVSIPHRTQLTRLLTTGIDQRIIKQSSEDCRRLLQQVNFYHC